MSEMLKALLLVVVAEMGDKTQLLAMAMAGKYKVKQVMIGVLVATISFLIFGLWTLRGDKIDDEKKKKNSFGPIITVAIAFFLAEMGDKTQLMTISISAQSHIPIFILMGSTLGMMIADGIGIIGGAWMCRHIPEKYIKWGAGAIFIIFGTITLYKALPAALLSPLYIVSYFLVLFLGIYLLGIKWAYRNAACPIALKNSKSLPNSEK